MKHFKNAYGNFTITFFQRQMEEKPNDNTLSCSAGAAVSLALIMLGSGRRTEDEIRRALNIYGLSGSGTSADGHLSGTADDKGFHHWLSQHLLFFNHPDNNQTMNIACQLWGSSSYHFLKEYTDNIRKYFNSQLDKVDFMNSTEAIRQKINSWVERQTKGHINNLLPSNSLDPSTSIILMNIMMFSGNWEKPFNPKNTGRGTFWTCKDYSINVEMMTQSGIFNIANVSNPPMKILEMAYSNPNICLYIFLPHPHSSADEIANHLSFVKVQEWTSAGNMTPVMTKVTLPKLTMLGNNSLKGTLSTMGMNDLFIPGKADLSNMTGTSMTGDKQLHVSHIDQEVFFAVTEGGTVVSVASRTEVVPGSQSEFKVDRGFICMLKNKESGFIYFWGKICKPKQHGLS